MMWEFEGKEIKSHYDLHPDCTDIVYLIIFEGDKKYLGKKCVRSLRRLKPTKAQLKIRKNYVRREVKNQPFIHYNGSSDNTKNLKVLHKEILYQCSTKKTATYIEAALLFEYDVLFSNEYLNENVLGSFYDNSLEGLIETVY